MDEKIKETKLAILDRILANVNDKEKALSTETLSSLAMIVDKFDYTEIWYRKFESNKFGALSCSLESKTESEIEKL